MLKKLIGLGMVFGIAGASTVLGGGCSSTTVNATGDSGLGADTGTIVHPDGGMVTPGTDGSSPTCPAPVDLTMIPTWKAPKTGTAGSCTASDIAGINTAIMAANPTFTSIYMAITNPTCQSCVFSSTDDATWQLIVWDPNMAAGTGFQNFGACFAVAQGGSAACGKGIQDDEFCLENACPDTCTDQNTCVMTADTGVCKSPSDEVTAGCGSSITALNTTCGMFTDAINVVCGGGSSEAGTD